MSINEVLQIAISQLGENYQESDLLVLKNILISTISQSSYISNRDIDISDLEKKQMDLSILCSEILESAIIKYQRRGTEYSKNKSELGESSTFVDADELLRNNIIKNGKRVIF